MKSNEHDLWITQLLSCLRNLPGGGNAKEIEEAWRLHEARKQPVVTIYGSYDTGKSSLLKRLLVDDEKKVPDWLTVSARRETFDVHEAEALGCTLRDTPGISGGNAEHEAIAKEALALSDAFLVVLPPQLLTSEREQIIKLLTGQLFRAGISQPFLPSSIIIVVSRMDEAGVDPTEDESGYQELARRKQDELQGILEKNHVDRSVVEIHTVAADPYQYVGNTQQPPKYIYDEFRCWDGIVNLADTLQRLPECLPDLRKKAALRYFSFVGEQALQTINEVKLHREAALEECRNWGERFSLIERQLDALIDAAQSDMGGLVEEQLVSISRYGFSTVEELVPILETRLANAFEQWALRHDALANKLVREAEAELEERASRPAAKMLFDLLGDETESESSNWNSSRLRDTLHKLGLLLNQGLKAFYEVRLGMTLEEAQLELKKLSSFDGIKKCLKGSKEGAKISPDKQLKQLHYVEIHKALEVVTPILIELGTLVLEEVQQQQVAQQRVERRAALREQVSREARRISDDYLNDWKQGALSFKGCLQEKQSAYIRNEHLLNQQVSLLKEHTVVLQGILAKPPT